MRVSKIAVWTGGAVFLPLALYAAAWFISAGIMLGHLDLWLDARRRDGTVITHGTPIRSGFPGRVRLDLPSFRMAKAGWHWQAEAVRLSANPIAPRTLHADLSGAHELSGLWPSPEKILRVVAARTGVSVTFHGAGRITAAHLESESTSASWSGEASPAVVFEKGRLAIHTSESAATDISPSTRIEFAANNIGSPDLRWPPLAGAIREARFAAEIKGRLPSGPLPQALETWRASGGDLEIKDLALDWPPMSLKASGALALDDRLQPVGAFTATFRGFFAAVDALVAEGMMENGEAAVARGVLTLLAKTPPGGGEPELALSVTVQNRKLYTGPITLMDMPVVVWPADVALP